MSTRPAKTMADMLLAKCLFETFELYNEYQTFYLIECGFVISLDELTFQRDKPFPSR